MTLPRKSGGGAQPFPPPLPASPPTPVPSSSFLKDTFSVPIFSVLSRWTDLTNRRFSRGMLMAHRGNMRSCSLARVTGKVLPQLSLFHVLLPGFFVFECLFFLLSSSTTLPEESGQRTLCSHPPKGHDFDLKMMVALEQGGQVNRATKCSMGLSLGAQRDPHWTLLLGSVRTDLKNACFG